MTQGEELHHQTKQPFSQRHCPVCGPETSASLRYPGNFDVSDLTAEVFSARRQPDRVHMAIEECEGCGVLYSNPAINNEVTAKLYADARVTYSDIETQIFDSYARILDRVVDRLPHREKFIEIGGGPGVMLRYGSEHGFKESIEIEPSREAENIFLNKYSGQGRRFIQSLFPPEGLEKESASLITTFQVLDHVPNPLSFLQSAYDLLKPGGAVLVVTHNTKAVSAKVLGKRSPIFDIEHTYLFDPPSISKYLGAAGFKGIEVFSVPNTYALSYWLHLAPIPKAMKKNLVKGLGPVGKTPVKLYAGNMAAIAWK